MGGRLPKKKTVVIVLDFLDHGITRIYFGL